MEDPEKFRILSLGGCTIPSPMRNVRFIAEGEHVLVHSSMEKVQEYLSSGKEPPRFESAGPRDKLYFDPANVRCGIVTCGGLCPGLNDVIRAIVLSLHHHYGIRTIYGFRYGYEGLISKMAHESVMLTPEVVSNIHEYGGTLLGSSRGNQNVSEMMDTLQQLNIGILFTIGGDGTQKGALAISEEAQKRGLRISVIGIPKTIDNDISYVQKTFGFETAVAEAKRAIDAAHAEAIGARNGIGLVKLMGRDSGFIAAYSVLVGSQVNFCFIPEIQFSIGALLSALTKRLEDRGHAVIVVAEGAGQDLLQATGEKDASGNVKYSDIGLFLRQQIQQHFKRIGMHINLKYIDPSYTIRSQPANSHDSALCLLFGHNAVHAGMAGRTRMMVGFWNHQFVYVPIQLAISQRKKINPESWIWSSVLAATGQPANMI